MSSEDVPKTPRLSGESEAFSLITRSDGTDSFSLLSRDSKDVSDMKDATDKLSLASHGSNDSPEEYEHVSPVTESNAAAERALAAMVFNPAVAPSVTEREPIAEGDPPLLLSTERTEEPIDMGPSAPSHVPTQFTIAALLNYIHENNIELPDTDDEEEFYHGKEGDKMLGGLDEDDVLGQIEAWEHAKKMAGGEAAGKEKEKTGAEKRKEKKKEQKKRARANKKAAKKEAKGKEEEEAEQWVEETEAESGVEMAGDASSSLYNDSGSSKYSQPE